MIGAAVLNAVMVEAIAELVRRGIEPPVLVSQNVDTFAEHNEALRRRYGPRIRSVT